MFSVPIPQPWGVSVFGRSDMNVEPDHAVLRLALNRLSKKPKDSLETASKAATSVRLKARSHGIADADVTASRTRVQTAWDGHGVGKKLLGHQCRIEFAIHIRSLDRVEDVLVSLVDAGADEIVSVHYDTQDKPTLRQKVRRDAIDAAQAKAALYAEAANLRLGGVVHIEDVDPEGLRAETAHRGIGSISSADGGGLVPGHVTVAAAVHVGYAIG